MGTLTGRRRSGVVGTLLAVIIAGCTAQGISPSVLTTLESDKAALQQQLGPMRCGSGLRSRAWRS